MIKLLGANEANQLDETNITTFLHDINIGDIIISSVENGKVWSGELEMICMDDETIFVQASVAPNTNADGNIIGMVWSLLDISKQKRVQQELQERNSQMEEDLSLAREFQQAFIRSDYPTFPLGVNKDDSILEFGHVYLPSGAVGGDFFEIFAVSENKLGIFISDVMGHGVRSALVVATIRGLIEELGVLRLDPQAFITHMNRDLTRIIKHHGQVTFATAFYMVLDLITGKITYTSAGHPAPFLLHSKSETVDMLPFEAGKLGPALGIFDSTVYEATVCQMEAGDALVLYTDGIFEAENEEICECYEIERVAQTLQQNMKETPSDLVDILINKVHEFCDNDYFDDDVCLIGVRLKSFLESSELKLNL
jgi:serine phosphatase RsbU (regulator of sigma subunit)